MNNAGINTILGPVLDHPSPRQGSLNSSLKNRVWSSNPNISINMARRYIDGLKSQGIGVIAKHIPGLGNVNNNPHNDEAEYNSSIEKLAEELLVFDALKEEVDGVMTSHVSIKASNIKDPVTISSNLMKKVFQGRLDEFRSQKLFITDDLSNMASIRKSMDRKGWDFAQLALESFIAGHDILLFSHVSPHSDFTVEDLKAAIDKIVTYSKTSQGRKRLNHSLEKILEFKKKISSSEMSKSTPVFALDFDAKELFADSDFSSGHDLVHEIYDKSIVGTGFADGVLSYSVLEELQHGQKLIIYGRKKYLNVLQGFFSDKNISYMAKSSFEDKRRRLNLVRYRSTIMKELANNKVLLFAENKDDFEIVRYIYLYEFSLLKNLILVINESPEVIPREFFNNVTMLTSFTQDPRSAISVAKVISGKNEHVDMTMMPIDLDYGAIFNVYSRPYLKFDDADGKIDFVFKTEAEKRLYERFQSIKRQYFIGVSIVLVVILMIVALMLYFVSSYLDASYDQVRKRDVVSALHPLNWLKSHPWLASIQFLLIALVIFVLYPNSYVYQVVNEQLPDSLVKAVIYTDRKVKGHSPDLYSDKISQW